MHNNSTSTNTNSKMEFRIDWIFPSLRKPFLFWNIASTLTVAAVGLFSKLLIGWMNKSKAYNIDLFSKLLESRPRHVPLLTVSNHHSCFDDPGIWGLLSWKHLVSRNTMRWSLAAHDICFTNSFHSYFFMLGKCIPVIRGKGVYQDAVNFCIEQLSRGQWVHVFPEGRVNMTKEFIRLKWGVGRMILDSPVTPVVIPIWHIGMDDVLPNEPPYILKMGKKVTFNFGEPIDLSSLIDELKTSNVSAEVARKAVTDKIQEELLSLKEKTEKLHNAYFRS
ncbi:tafazzin isoform X1 [Homalodisca vitripennis]|uniref:Tafazzin family protein n=1 Tax=Homalodisca liturata TaxID=320908 RepID=A0A1B6ISC9_9HEMI|nr:tafazzin isoform X1 [Homalodisca vitripennis]